MEKNNTDCVNPIVSDVLRQMFWVPAQCNMLFTEKKVLCVCVRGVNMNIKGSISVYTTEL